MSLNAERWARLGDQLTDLEYRYWRATLPEGYQPLGRSYVGLRLELTVAELREIEQQIVAVRLQIGQMAAAHFEDHFGPGGAPAWLYEHLAVLRRPRFGAVSGGVS